MEDKDGGNGEGCDEEKKLYKLGVYSQDFWPDGEDLIFRSEDFNHIKAGDVIEIYHEEEEFSRLLLEVKPANLYPENNFNKPLQKETVYVRKSIAEAFKLINFKNVIVNRVERSSVALDFVELLFKDQYMGRSEMWRLKKCLVGSIVYMQKKVSLCKDIVRCSVFEMWSQGEKMACGAVTEDTKVVFRSTTAMVYLFIQMSTEMWHFDMYGDLYFEKAVNGFLYEMFYKWQKTGAAHEVTIVLFSRVFYQAKDESEFPPHMKDCIQTDYRNRYFEDFYQVVVQNERFEDWFPTLHLLRQTFTNYKQLVLDCHKRDGITVPKGYISTAAQGNFLETLNIALNTFEKHFINRNLDRTGQQAIVITPGVGIFEVDWELTVITKQRMIDSGVGSDLLCVGEQPLHAVPLFKSHPKTADLVSNNNQEDYSIPWWINLSFYTSNKKIGYSDFIPRIKLPPLHNQNKNEKKSQSCYFPASVSKSRGPNPETPYEYEEYDNMVLNFTMPRPYSTDRSGSLPRRRANRKQGARKSSLEGNNTCTGKSPNSKKNSYDDTFVQSRKTSDMTATPSMNIPMSVKEGKDLMAMYSKSVGGEVRCASLERKTLRGSLDDTSMYPVHSKSAINKMFPPSGRALINPFDPRASTIKITSNRRRWTHIFPHGPVVPPKQDRFQLAFDRKNSEGRISPTGSSSSSIITSTPNREVSYHTLQKIADTSVGACVHLNDNTHKKRLRSISYSEVKYGNIMWGATVGGEKSWDATLATGVDWKSITYPACLPLTTDYKPDEKSLETEYVIRDYQMTPEEYNSDLSQIRSPLQKPPLTTTEVFLELISQRLAQNFQLIINKKDSEAKSEEKSIVSANSSVRTSESSRKKGDQKQQRSSLVRNKKSAQSEVLWLSIGKIFHKLTLTGQMINVVRYSAKHPPPSLNFNYRYRFRAPDNDTYEFSFCRFDMEQLESYNWNYLDLYVCTRGDDEDYSLSENLKYWRYKLYVLPLKPFYSQTAAIVKGPPDMRCDIYPRISHEDRVLLAEAFIKFVETCLNKIKRPNTLPSEKSFYKSRSQTMSGEVKPVIDRQKFRERMGSNRFAERDREKTMSGPGRHLERSRTESGGARDYEGMRPLVDTPDSQESLFPPMESQERDDRLLASNATNEQIAEAMRSGVACISILPKQDALPPLAFVSADAVVWLMEHVDEVYTEEKAVQIMQSLLEDNLICHASGNTRHKFIYGFFIYYFVTKDKNNSSIYGGSLQAFQSDWLEVELEKFRLEDDCSEVNFLDPNLDTSSVSSTQSHPSVRHITLDPDLSKKSERPEWGEVNYQSKYRPDQAFEILIKWSVATGGTLANLIQTWATRAQNGQLLSIIPSPGDPFALPSQNSDPMRGPIFVPLNIACLSEEGDENLFCMFDDKTWDYRLFLFREHIVRRFGFVSCVTDPKKQLSSATFSTTHQYIHCTGNMFVLIPTTLQLSIGIQGMEKKNRKHKDSVRSRISQENSSVDLTSEYEDVALISRNLTGDTVPQVYSDGETGFLWSWNFMISKKWKQMSTSGATGDIPFMDKMLADFRRFCNNDEGRLKEFWDECKDVQSLQPK